LSGFQWLIGFGFKNHNHRQMLRLLPGGTSALEKLLLLTFTGNTSTQNQGIPRLSGSARFYQFPLTWTGMLAPV